MEPIVALIGLFWTLGKDLLALINRRASQSSTNAALHKELQLVLAELLHILEYVEDRLAYVVSAGFVPKALVTLLGEMEEFVSKAKDLFEKRCLKENVVRKFRKEVTTAFQGRMTAAIFEVLFEILMEQKAERMAEKLDVQTIEQALANFKLEEVVSFPINRPHLMKTFQEHLKDVLSSNVLPTPGPTPTSTADLIYKFEEEKKEAESVEQFWKEKMEMVKAATMEDQEEGDNIKNNPNLSMSFISDVFGEGLGMLTRQDGKIEVTLEGPLEVIRTMMGMRPMKVSEKLGYFYFEVQVVKMVELSGTSKTCSYAGVGVGLATRDEFRNDKMVGWYPESFGYDGRMDEVYCNQCPQEPFRIGVLAKGDTLGIGLLQLPSQCPAIFFVKNGILQGCTQKHCLKQSSTGHLHPVVTLVSRCAKLRVNFHGPFHLPSGLDLAAALEIIQ